MPISKAFYVLSELPERLYADQIYVTVDLDEFVNDRRTIDGDFASGWEVKESKPDEPIYLIERSYNKNKKNLVSEDDLKEIQENREKLGLPKRKQIFQLVAGHEPKDSGEGMDESIMYNPSWGVCSIDGRASWKKELNEPTPWLEKAEYFLFMNTKEGTHRVLEMYQGENCTGKNITIYAVGNTCLTVDEKWGIKSYKMVA